MPVSDSDTNVLMLREAIEQLAKRVHALNGRVEILEGRSPATSPQLHKDQSPQLSESTWRPPLVWDDLPPDKLAETRADVHQMAGPSA